MILNRNKNIKIIEGLRILLDEKSTLIDFDRHRELLQLRSKNQANHNWKIIQLNDVKIRREIKKYI